MISGVSYDGTTQQVSWERLAELKAESVIHDKWLSVDFSSEINRSSAKKILVLLTNRDQLLVDRVELLEDEIQTQLYGQQISIPVDYIAEITWNTSIDQYQRSNISGLQEDLLSLNNGDQVRGELLEIEEDHLTFATEAQSLLVPRQNLNKVVFNPELSLQPSLPENLSRLFLENGSCLSVKSWDVSSSLHCEYDLKQATKLVFPRKELLRIDLPSRFWSDLAESMLVSQSGEDFWGKKTQHRYAQNAELGVLLSEDRFDVLGFGVESNSLLEFELPDDVKAISFGVGLDQRASQYAAVEVVVKVNGSSIWSDQLSGESDRFKWIPKLNLSQVVPASSKRVLTLEVKFGQRANVGDLVNWHRPLLLMR